MDALEFIGIIAVAAVVIFWYLRNLALRADGVRGMLALDDDPDAAKPGAKRGSYRIRKRLARRAHELRDAEAARAAAVAEPSFKTFEEAVRMRRKFRRQDEARYRAKDRAARFRQDAENT